MAEKADFLARIRDIERAVSADGLADQALRDLREAGFDPLPHVEAWVSVPETDPPTSKDFEVIHSEAGKVRRVQTTKHLLKKLPDKLCELADDAAVAGWLVQFPSEFLEVPARMRQLAEWLKKNQPKIPDRRHLYGPTRMLKLLMSFARTETSEKLSQEELSQKIAAVLLPVAEHFNLEVPTKDSLRHL